MHFFFFSRWTTKKENGDDEEEEPDADEIEAMLERAEEDSDDDEQVHNFRDILFFISSTGKKTNVVIKRIAGVSRFFLGEIMVLMFLVVGKNPVTMAQKM